MATMNKLNSKKENKIEIKDTLKNRHKKSFLNFNKEIIFGEIGAIIGGILLSFLVSRFNQTPNIISGAAVIGSIIGAAIFWITSRIKDQKAIREYNLRSLSEDIGFFTPAAFLLTLCIYYPVLFFLSKRLLIKNFIVLASVIPAQIIAFLLFLIAINLYRLILIKTIKKEL